jgi:hexosaminidase
VLDASTLLTRSDSELESCSNRPQMRLDGNLPAQGARPVYKLSVGDMCWLWRSAPLQGIQQVTLTAGRVAWRFGDDAGEAVVRPKLSAAGEFEIHADYCTGPLLGRLPLAPAAARQAKQIELTTRISTSNLNDAHDLCIFATGDPREGQWALSQIRFSR